MQYTGVIQNGSSIFKTGTKGVVDIREVFNIWNLTRARYASSESTKFFINFVHDRDFAVLLASFLTHYEKQSKILESEGEKFRIKAPNPGPAELKTSTELHILTDKFIFRQVYHGLTAELMTLMAAIRSSVTNDRIRSVIIRDMEQHLQDFEKLYKYGKVKGWQEDPPAHKTARPVRDEPISISEAFHIWDHLSQRYYHIAQTKLLARFAHDKELSVIMNLGLRNLEVEVKLIEQQAIEFEVPLPERSPVSLPVADDPESLQDVYIYNTILRGIQDAMDLHVQSTIEIIRNDPLRDLLFGFWKNEFSLYDKFLKYGKTKGWLTTTPIYNPS